MNIKKLRITLAIIFSSLGIVSASLGFTGALNDHSSNKEYADWLGKVDDHTLLRDVSLPGSHDTMALYSIADLAGQCQTLSLNDQLNLGVRFLDIRLKEDHNSLKAVHGFIDQKASFKDISKTVTSFLEKHPSEFIIMSIKEEAKSSNSDISFEQALLKYLDSPIYLKEQTTVPNYVSEIRGKVLLLSRYKDPSIGIPAYEGWQDSTSFTLPNDIYVQDTFKITSREQKQEEVIKCFNEAGHALKINFLSAYRTNGFPPSQAMTAAKDINPWINEEISKYSDRGIVLYENPEKRFALYLLWSSSDCFFTIPLCGIKKFLLF